MVTPQYDAGRAARLAIDWLTDVCGRRRRAAQLRVPDELLRAFAADATWMSQNFLDFLESHLGTIAGGTHIDAPDDQIVNVARFENQPVEDALTYVTTGLSRHILHQLENQDLRMELLGCVWSRFRDSGLDHMLHILARDILDSHHAPPHGSVAGPRGPIAAGSTLEAFYFMHPAYHPEALERFPHPTDPIYIVWPVPISASEAAFIRERGWSAFEERLFAEDPDLMDLARHSIA